MTGQPGGFSAANSLRGRPSFSIILSLGTSDGPNMSATSLYPPNVCVSPTAVQRLRKQAGVVQYVYMQQQQTTRWVSASGASTSVNTRCGEETGHAPNTPGLSIMMSSAYAMKVTSRRTRSAALAACRGGGWWDAICRLRCAEPLP